MTPKITYDNDGTPLIDGERPSWAIDEILPSGDPSNPNVTLKPTNAAARFVAEHYSLVMGVPESAEIKAALDA